VRVEPVPKKSRPDESMANEVSAGKETGDGRDPAAHVRTEAESPSRSFHPTGNVAAPPSRVTVAHHENDTNQDHEHEEPEQIPGNPVRTKQTPPLTHGNRISKNGEPERSHLTAIKRSLGIPTRLNRKTGRVWPRTTATIIERHDPCE